MSNIVPFEEKRNLASALVKSNLFGIKDEAQALALMAICEAEGMHPAKAVQTYHIIQGRPAIKADALLARFQESGGKVNWTEYTDSKVVGTFTHPQGGSITVDWTIDRAKQIGLAGKDNWRNYPRNMLRARCIAEGVRAVFPGVSSGVYTVEEVTDMPTEKNMGKADVIVTISAEREKEITDIFDICESFEQLSQAWAQLTVDEKKAMSQQKDEAKTRIQNNLGAINE